METIQDVLWYAATFLTCGFVGFISGVHLAGHVKRELAEQVRKELAFHLNRLAQIEETKRDERRKGFTIVK